MEGKYYDCATCRYRYIGGEDYPYNGAFRFIKSCFRMRVGG